MEMAAGQGGWQWRQKAAYSEFELGSGSLNLFLARPWLVGQELRQITQGIAIDNAPPVIPCFFIATCSL